MVKRKLLDEDVVDNPPATPHPPPGHCHQAVRAESEMSALTELEETPKAPPTKRVKVDTGLKIHQAIAVRRMVAAEISLTQGANLKVDLLLRGQSPARDGADAVTPVTRYATFLALSTHR